MKKISLLKIMSVITLFAVMTVLVSCGEKNLPTDGSIGSSQNGATENSAEPTAEAPTDMPTEAPTETPTENSTETPTETTADSGTLSLNADLISDYGLTFDELSQKYGKVTHYKSPGGGTYYKFERGYGYYCCGDVNRIVDWVHDDDLIDETGGNGKSYAVVEGDTTCYSIEDITAGDLFSQSFGTLSAEDIAAIPGITHVITSEDELDPRYYSVFKYSGFSNGKTCISIYTEKENEITPESEVSIFTNTPYTTE